MMKVARLSLLFVASAVLSARADLTVVQNIEGAGPATMMTIKIKGNKARVDATPEVSTIIDSKTGDMLNLLHDQKQFMRMSAAQAKAAAAMAMGDTKKSSEPKPQLKATGNKETINGYETEEYTFESPTFKASYWISMKYPNGAEILKQLQGTAPEAWGVTAEGMPDYKDFPGLPLRTRMTMNGQQFTSTLMSAKQDPIADSEFVAPQGFEEMKMPNMDALLGGQGGEAQPAASPKK